MKVLLISENIENSTLLENVLTSLKLDYIHYRWFMKALDNIEEINPQLIIIDVNDFPRHWKVLAQYVKSAIFANPVKIILYSKNEISPSEINKANVLQVSSRMFTKDPVKIKECIMEYLNSNYSGNPVFEYNESSEVSVSYTLKTVDDLLDDSLFLPTVDNLLDEREFLATVDNLFDYGTFVSYKVNIKDDKAKKEFSESEYTFTPEIINEEYNEKSDYEEEVPTVSGIFSSHNEELPVSSENDDIFNFTEEDIQNETTLYTVDNLFGLEENDYSIASVDNLFYEEENCLKSVPNNQGQCRQMVGSLLHRIMEYYGQ